uniref:Uncharacterized protein n=1 Tax=Anguilla anguilla TaxID=7936 RepID=A0A0E9WB53_ANGAN
MLYVDMSALLSGNYIYIFFFNNTETRPESSIPLTANSSLLTEPNQTSRNAFFFLSSYFPFVSK